MPRQEGYFSLGWICWFDKEGHTGWMIQTTKIVSMTACSAREGHVAAVRFEGEACCIAGVAAVVNFDYLGRQLELDRQAALLTTRITRALTPAPLYITHCFTFYLGPPPRLPALPY